MQNKSIKNLEETEMSQYILIIEGKEVEVTKEVYDTYWGGYNQLYNLERKDRYHGLVSYDADDTEAGFGVEKYTNTDGKEVENLVEKKILIELLKEAIKELDEEEKELVRDMYYIEKSMRMIAAEKGVDHKTISLRHKKILNKLQHYFQS